jgi:hypothetical protein
MYRQYYGQIMASDWDADLDDLRWHYGDAYLIDYLPGPGRWIAQRRDSHQTISADSAGGLLDLIRADYAERRVSRRIAGADRPQTPSCRFPPED